MVKQFTALSNTAQVIRTGKTLLRKLKIKVYNTSAPELYIQLWNNASPTVGTTAPNQVIKVPAGDAMNPLLERTVIFDGPKGGEEYATALAIACTTVHDGAVAPTAGQEPNVTVDYEQVGA